MNKIEVTCNTIVKVIMAKTKTKGSKSKNSKMANGHAKPKETPEELYAAAITFVEQSQPSEALSKAQQLLSRVQGGSATQVLPALNLLGEISVELGDVESARAYFEQAVALDPNGEMPESVGGSAEKFLWLAQLCDEGGKASVQWFERGITALQAEIANLERSGVEGMDDEVVAMARLEKKRQLANALCGIAEIYMTDLSWEADAEARCESLITAAVGVEDETSPEVLQTLASVRLSQERLDDAQAALRRSLAAWQDLDPEDPAVPEFAARISLARLLMEAEMELEASEVLNRLVQEDDQSVEAWYLGGWCQYLLAEHEKARHDDHKTSGEVLEEDNVEATMKGSRHWLKTSMKLYELLEYEDDRLYAHTADLVKQLDAVLGPEDEQAEGEEAEWDDEWTGIGDDEDAADEDMQDA